MRQNKTSKKNRITYIYDFDDGSKIELKPGVDGVTEMDVAMLHESDDEEFNEQRRYDYHVPVHYQAFRNDNDDSSEDGNAYLADDSTNPEAVLINATERSEMRGQFKAIWNNLQPQQRELALKKMAGRSNVDIASEEGVTEAAIRNRLKKIQEKFKNLR